MLSDEERNDELEGIRAEKKDITDLMTFSAKPAQWLFALMIFVFSIWLLSNLSEQAKFPASKPFVSQPGFWPALSLIGMCLCSFIFLAMSWINRDKDRPSLLRSELLVWLSVLEYPLWFLAYVWAVPQLGYLLSSVLFALLMCFRLGYRSRIIYLAAVVSSIAIVVIFKSFLEVKIPGGEIYRYFPDVVRNFLIINL